MLSSYLGFILVVQSWKKTVEEVLILMNHLWAQNKRKKRKKNFENKEEVSYFNKKPLTVKY